MYDEVFLCFVAQIERIRFNQHKSVHA